MIWATQGKHVARKFVLIIAAIREFALKETASASLNLLENSAKSAPARATVMEGELATMAPASAIKAGRDLIALSDMSFTAQYYPMAQLSAMPAGQVQHATKSLASLIAPTTENASMGHAYVNPASPGKFVI